MPEVVFLVVSSLPSTDSREIPFLLLSKCYTALSPQDHVGVGQEGVEIPVR